VRPAGPLSLSLSICLSHAYRISVEITVRAATAHSFPAFRLVKTSPRTSHQGDFSNIETSAGVFEKSMGARNCRKRVVVPARQAAELVPWSRGLLKSLKIRAQFKVKDSRIKVSF
jgi:hypothetical protein